MVVALVTAIATLLSRRARHVQRLTSVLGSLVYLLAVAIILQQIRQSGPQAYQLSNWPAPFGITLVADELAAFFLGLTAVVSLAAVVFSVFYVDDFGQRVSYHPLYHLMLVGVTGSFLTGDIFNLFVWFEVMLMPSYVFVAFYSQREHTSAALKYVVLNLIGSAIMLVAIGGLYATTGTLNMADMARRLASAGEFGIAPAPVLGLAALLFSVFALKAGIVPFQFWVPSAYRAAPAPISAVLAGITKKVGIYAIIRLFFTVFAAGTLPSGLGLGFAGDSFLGFFGPVFFLMAAGSIILGGLGAVVQDDVDGMLAHSSIGQVGFIVLPLAIAATAPSESIRVLGIAAALVYALNHAVAKSLLFLVSGSIYRGVGSIQFDDLGGLTGRAPVLSGSFFVGGLALVGIPPLSGFFGKLLVFDTAGQTLADGGSGGMLALAVALGGAILTIAYTSRAWNRGFWGTESERVAEASQPLALVAIVAVLASTLVLIGVGFEPIFTAARAAAEAALDTGGYVDLVDPTTVSDVAAERGGSSAEHALSLARKMDLSATLEVMG
ncbi:MAG: multicomponent Na+:H+ antiporter subunit D [Haloarculaceae archaeon]|jgi:multicomponent Na+:H+ antiporter subunit D